MNINELILWQKYRPTTIEDIILLPRIRKHFENGIQNNYIFYGNYGTGKTSLARILIGKYSKDKSFLEINSSLYTSIDVLRTQIEDFCKFKSMLSNDNGMKYVFLDEFERTSPQFQDAFKAFVEKYSALNVRFIITTNHINKIENGIKNSRIKTLNFDPQTSEEVRYLKTAIAERIVKNILPSEGKTMEKEVIKNIINKSFPDFRRTLLEVGSYLLTGGDDVVTNTINDDIRNKVYNMIYDKSLTYDKIYHFVMDEIGEHQVDLLFKILGRDFINHSINNGINVDKLFKCNFIISGYEGRIQDTTDPIVLMMTVIGKFREILI